MKTKIALRTSTIQIYNSMYKCFVRDSIGFRPVASIKYSDVKKLYMDAIKDGTKITSLETVDAILIPIFKTAIRDGYIRANPVEGVMSAVKKEHHWSYPKKKALTEKEQASLITFMSKDARYERLTTLFVFLLGTGCRIGEALGLTWDDCDFKNNTIDINHILIYGYRKDIQKNGFYISKPKTKSGVRMIPMLSFVREALLKEKHRQEIQGKNLSIVDGLSGFIFTSKMDTVIRANDVERCIPFLVKKHNEEEVRMAEANGREPILIDKFTPHTLRHTFCTRFCENESNLKVIQEIMGRADIATTMNIYNEATSNKKVESFAKLEGKIILFNE